MMRWIISVTLIALTLVLGSLAQAQSNAPGGGGGAGGATSSVSNGQWVNSGDVIWTQITTQGVGTVSVSTDVRIAKTTGTVATTDTTIASCALATNVGYGFGFTATSTGWLQGVVTQINTGNFPQGTFFIQHFILANMPSGGNNTSCTNTFVNYAGNPPMLLDSYVTGSFAPVGFTGTTVTSVHPWSIPGYTTVATISNPSAGANASFAFAANQAARTCIMSAFATLATNSTAAARTVYLSIVFNSGTTGVPQINYLASTSQAASLTSNYSFSPGAAAVSVTPTAGNIQQVVPFNNGQPICFNAGLNAAAVGINVLNIQTGDQLSNLGLVEQIQQDNN